MDMEKCFDKLWLEACINELYESGVRNDMLNLLYIENKHADVAVKVNNKLSRRISVENVIMQGSVWGSLKCTNMMDTLNKQLKKNKSLMYQYKGDPNIEIGVLGMVDDTLGVMECGENSIVKNAVINSFVETKKLKLHEEKSVVIHVGNAKKCKSPCPSLKVHQEEMHEVESAKYLGNCVTSRGGVRATIDDRRSRGWGKVTQLMAILGEVALGAHRVEAGLILRESILVSSLLWSAEAWSAVTDKELKQLEQVDSHFLKLLVKGHSKCPIVFQHLETGTLKLRHILTIHRLLYHHHIVNLGENETVKKVYNKQKEESTKGDWIKLVEKDFLFIEANMNDEEIKTMSKNKYKTWVKEKVKKAAFESYVKEKNTLTKIKDIEYTCLETQQYLVDTMFSSEERNLLFALRSRCYPVKENFKNINKQNMNCKLGCAQTESQEHVFSLCPRLKNGPLSRTTDYNSVFENVFEQKLAMKVFSRIDKERNSLLKLLPGEDVARTRASLSTMQQT